MCKDILIQNIFRLVGISIEMLECKYYACILKLKDLKQVGTGSIEFFESEVYIVKDESVKQIKALYL